MSLRQDIRSVTTLKAQAAELIEQVNREQRPVVITQRGRARAVLLDPESYERMRDAIGLLKLIAEGEEAVRRGRTESQEALFARLERRVEASRKRGRAQAV